MEGWVNGRVRRINRAANMAITPPSLLGIERRIAYAQRKYHSGAMWTGVTRGLAGIKFSGSPSILGAKKLIMARVISRTINPTVSLVT